MNLQQKKAEIQKGCKNKKYSGSICQVCQAKLSILDFCIEEQNKKIEELRRQWTLKCNRMDIMSAPVAIFELGCILEEIYGEPK